MKKKFAIAMAITAGLCFAGGLKPAFAGHWEPVPNPKGGYLPESDPNYGAWLAEEQDRTDGEASYDIYTHSGGTTHHYEDTYDWIGAIDGTGFGDTFTMGRGEPDL